jgi:hypothetical protein
MRHPIFGLGREVRPVRQADDQWKRLYIIFSGQLKQALRELSERHCLSEAWLAKDQQGTIDVHETESVMHV